MKRALLDQIRRVRKNSEDPQPVLNHSRPSDDPEEVLGSRVTIWPTGDGSSSSDVRAAAGGMATVLSRSSDGCYTLALHWDTKADKPKLLYHVPRANLVKNTPSPTANEDGATSPKLAGVVVQQYAVARFLGQSGSSDDDGIRPPSGLFTRERGRSSASAQQQHMALQVQQALRDFVAGPEIQMSIHVERLAKLSHACRAACDRTELAALAAHALVSAPRSLDTFDILKLGMLTPEGRKAADKTPRGGLSAWRIAPINAQQLALPAALKEIVKTLDARVVSRRQYARADGRVLRVLVAGGGPIGLRTALEMATLGHDVTVFEKRDGCSRLNCLKLWEETMHDLVHGLALTKFGEPAIVQQSGYKTASTARLQLALLKVALLFGVKLRIGKGAAELHSLAQADEFDVLLLATAFQPRLLRSLREQAGPSMLGALEGQFDSLSQAAIAVVAHYEASARTPEAKAWLEAAEPFDWSRQFFTKANLAEANWRISNEQLEADGVFIQNMVSYPNRVSCRVDAHGRPCKRMTCPALEDAVGIPPTYYCVFTLDGKPERLRALLRDDDEALPVPDDVVCTTRKLLSWAKQHKQLDDAKVDEFVHSVMRNFTLHYAKGGGRKAGGLLGRGGSGAPTTALSDACRLLRTVAPPYDPCETSKSVDLFDFSGTSRMASDSAAALVIEVDGQPRERGPLLVQPVGDALQEPFWPQGLGLNRGILNAQDACWTAHSWDLHDRATWPTLLTERNWLYANVTLPMSAMARSRLRGYGPRDKASDGAYKKFTVDPATRYHLSDAPLGCAGPRKDATTTEAPAASRVGRLVSLPEITQGAAASAEACEQAAEPPQPLLIGKHTGARPEQDDVSPLLARVGMGDATVGQRAAAFGGTKARARRRGNSEGEEDSDDDSGRPESPSHRLDEDSDVPRTFASISWAAPGAQAERLSAIKIQALARGRHSREKLAAEGLRKAKAAEQASRVTAGRATRQLAIKRGLSTRSIADAIRSTVMRGIRTNKI